MKQMKTDYNKLREIIKNTDKAILKKVILSCDGHTLYDKKQFLEAGLHKDIVKAFNKNVESGDDHKHTIYGNDGEVVKKLKAVYGLELLEFIARTFDVSSWKMGRGSRAEHLKEQLVTLWDTNNDTK